jgi:hypothetical protein
MVEDLLIERNRRKTFAELGVCTKLDEACGSLNRKAT